MQNNIITITFLLVFYFHSIVFFQSSHKSLIAKKDKKFYYLLALLNIPVGFIWLYILHVSIVCAYLFLMLVYAIEIWLFFDASKLAKISVALNAVVNMLCIGSIVVGIFAFCLDTSVYHMFYTPELFLFSRIVIFSICGLLTTLWMHIIPSYYWDLCFKSESKTIVFVALEIITIIGTLSNSISYEVEFYARSLIVQHIVQGFSWLTVSYIGMFVLVGVEMIDEHKRDLEQNVKNTTLYKDLFVNNCELSLQVNCTTKKLEDCRMKGRLKQNFIGMYYEDFTTYVIKTHIHPDDVETTVKMSSIKTMINTFNLGINHYYFEYRFRDVGKSDYEWFRVEISLNDTTNAGQLGAILIVESIQFEKELQFDAERDALSKLYNKKLTQELVQEYLDTGKDGVLFMIDIDNFKKINDNLGHDVGDQLIVDVADALVSLFRKDDIIGRIGGDEFIVFVKLSAEKFDIENKAGEICKILNKTYSNDTTNVTVSASIGISKTSLSTYSFDQLYKLADVALYTSKEKGKNTFTYMDG